MRKKDTRSYADRKAADPNYVTAQRARVAKWRELNLEVVRESNKWSRIKSAYRLTKEAFLALLGKQRGLCAICGQPASGSGQANSRLHIDHDHRTGKVRGLLCTHCNHGLGKFMDSPILLRAAAEYLEWHR